VCDAYKKVVTKTTSYGGLLHGGDGPHAVSSDDCELSSGFVVGGTKSRNNEFPHMAAIGAKNLDGSNQFFCGGSLISDQFVLTAAHCKKSRFSNLFARLGDQNINSRSDGLLEFDVPISEIIRHERYSTTTRQHDIALAKLSRKLPKFTKFIRPACLWQESALLHEAATATGWGLTEDKGSSSDELLKVQLNIQDIGKCQNLFDDFKYEINDNQICAGVESGGHDTCQGGKLDFLISLSYSNCFDFFCKTLVDPYKLF
jgi:secreted trypsin-like serine protease